MQYALRGFGSRQSPDTKIIIFHADGDIHVIIKFHGKPFQQLSKAQMYTSCSGAKCPSDAASIANSVVIVVLCWIK